MTHVNFKMIKRVTAYLLLLVLLVPNAVFAQSKLQSTNYIIDDVNFANTSILTTTKTGAPPIISSKGPTIINLTANSVTITWETDKASKSRINYGTTSDYGLIVGSNEIVTIHTLTISGLSEQTTYHFSVESEDSLGNIGRSGDNTFTTPAQSQFKEVSVSRITYNEALISIVAGGLKKVVLDYGPTSNFGQSKEVSSVTTITEHTFSLDKLTSGTKYFYRLRGYDTGNNLYELSGLTFSTIAEPKVDGFTAVALSANEVLVTVLSNTRTSLALAYKSERDPKELTAADTAITTRHEVRLDKLFGQTTYNITATVTDEGGKRVSSSTISVTTLEDKEVPVPTDPKVDLARAENKIFATVQWDANEPVQGTLLIKSKANPNDVKEIKGSGTFSTHQVIVANGLAPRTPYEIVAVSKDIANNEAQKSVFVVTPSIRRSILELIMQNLEKVLGPIQALLERLSRGR